jgi:hypothetical protein
LEDRIPIFGRSSKNMRSAHSHHDADEGPFFFMPTRQELKDLAALRLTEAEALYAAGLYDGVSYLCGYVVELALKARICRLLSAAQYPETGVYKQVYTTHNFDQLLFLAGLSPKMTPATADPDLFTNWSLATRWGPERRYKPFGTYTQQNALDLLDAPRQETWRSDLD